MPTRSRSRDRAPDADALYDEFGFVSDEDVEAFMAEQEMEEQTEAKAGFWNLQTASGMGLIGLGAIYSLQQLGLLQMGLDLTGFVSVLPILASVLIILTGFGVLSWSPAARRRKKARERAAKIRRRQKTMGRSRPSTDEVGRRAARAFEQAEKVVRHAGRVAGQAAERASRSSSARSGAQRKGRRLTKDYKNRKISGVAAGLANYFGIDPTVVRILFVVAAIFGQGAGVLLYLILSVALPRGTKDDDADPYVRITDD